MCSISNETNIHYKLLDNYFKNAFELGKKRNEASPHCFHIEMSIWKKNHLKKLKSFINNYNDNNSTGSIIFPAVANCQSCILTKILLFLKISTIWFNQAK